MAVYKQYLTRFWGNSSTDTIPTASAALAGYTRIDINNGNMYVCDGSSWVAVGGSGGWSPSASEMITNKTIDAETNTLIHVLHAPSAKRFGYWIPAIGSFSASGLLSGGTITSSSTSNVFDSAEGVVTQQTTSTISGNAAFIYQFVTNSIGTGRRAITLPRAMTFKTRIKASTSTSTRLYAGFLDTASASPSLGDTGIGTSGNGVLVGFSNTDTNWTIYSNNGGGSAASKTLVTGPIAKDTNWHTIEIVYNGTTDVTVIFDGTSQTISTALPASTANQYALIYIENATGASRNVQTKYGQVSAF